MRLWMFVNTIWLGGELALVIAFMTTERVRVEFVAWSAFGFVLALGYLYLSIQDHRKVKRLIAQIGADLAERQAVARMKAGPPE